jgi:hypothetical protein
MPGLASPLLLCVVVALVAQQLGSPAAAAAAADLPTQAAKPSIIAVGDGLTESAFKREHDGWGLQLQERFVRKVRHGPDCLLTLQVCVAAAQPPGLHTGCHAHTLLPASCVLLRRR